MIKERIAHFQRIMKKNQIDICIIPSSDPHLSEYLPEHWQNRAWLSGFTGSVGTLLIGLEKAILWVDSRYWEQAEHQLENSGIIVGKLLNQNDIINSVLSDFSTNRVVSIAADMVSIAQKKQYQQILANEGIQFKVIPDLIDDIWHDRPNLPMKPIYQHKQNFVFEGSQQKITKIRQKMLEIQANYHLISSLDDIAWISNLRGSDVDSNPVFLAHLLIGLDKNILFIHECKINNEIKSFLKQSNIEIMPYDDVADYLARLSGKLWVDDNKVAVSTLVNLPDDVILHYASNPSTLLKSIKNHDEIQCIKNAMLKDGIALCGFFAELEQNFQAGKTIYEHDIDEMLIHHRSKQADYVSPSFDTIAGFNANGAMPHYHAQKNNSSQIVGNGLLLIDSGAQYHDGTTDITRVIPVGEINFQQKQDFTLVLKAHIALATAVFPENFPAPMIDAICRKPMWQYQCDYGHGTGHGVGYFLNVHEGPQSIAYRGRIHEDNVLREGMLTSNEPGLYRVGKWGIRIENLVVNQKVETPKETEFGQFLYFETLTLCPIDTRLIHKTMMTDEEILWINQYHQMVHDKLSPHLQGMALAWLQERTKAI